MAKPISYAVEPPKIGPDAHEELERLLQTLHEHGILRFANDLAAANNQVAQVLVNGLNREGSLNAIQNLSILMMALSTFPPGQFYKLVFAVRDMLDTLGRDRGESEADREPPGVRGLYKMLNDEAFWRTVTPFIEGLKAFNRRMDEPVDKPISSFSGKPSDA